jgi:4-hydroxythreonine-4-phosphate dehydrogenase
MTKPWIAITMGDPAGVGPETIASLWAEQSFHQTCQGLVVGSAPVLRRAVALTGGSIEVVEVDSPQEVAPSPALMPLISSDDGEAADVPAATVDPRGGQAAYDALLVAVELALRNDVDAITTAPLNKAALAATGLPLPGHTELLAQLCHAPNAAMMLYLPPGKSVLGRVGLGVTHATLHTPLAHVSAQLNTQRITTVTQLTHDFMQQLLATNQQDQPPRLGVAALNPHAGEQGLFGLEEVETIGPAVAQSQAAGLKVTGPLPADTLFVRAADGEFDAVVAMYHDQGHIALKLLGMHKAVNITLGLPIIRTSVAHGTAFDLAWQGRAQITGLKQAVQTAAQLAPLRHQLAWNQTSSS